MRNILTLVILIININYAVASELLWYWDKDGASKGLLPDKACQCYFSLDFPVKVIPSDSSNFTLYEAHSQIITLKLDEFMNSNKKDLSVSTILNKHLDYELEYLKTIVGNDALTIEQKLWNEDNNILSWVIKRQSKTGIGYYVSNSVINSDCVLYMTSLVKSTSEIQKISGAQQMSLKTLKSHKPNSEGELKELLSEFAKN